MANLVDNNGFTPLLQACETIASSPPNKVTDVFTYKVLYVLPVIVVIVRVSG